MATASRNQLFSHAHVVSKCVGCMLIAEGSRRDRPCSPVDRMHKKGPRRRPSKRLTVAGRPTLFLRVHYIIAVTGMVNLLQWQCHHLLQCRAVSPLSSVAQTLG